MGSNKDDNKDSLDHSKDNPIENLSGEDILNKIDKDASENDEAGASEEENGNDLMKKLGLSKKDKLKKENGELKQKMEELNDKYLRLFAEFDNYKKRSLKERADFFKTAGADVISSLLPVLDDFNRALKQMEVSQDVNALKEGIKLIYQKINGILDLKGLKQMKSVGEVFNPEFHDAITEVDVTDKSMVGKVVDEIECGYYLNDKIVRHAKVVVGR